MINKILEIARGELGYKEGANNNTKYGAEYGLNYNPWCEMFVWWCANKAGIGTDIIPKTASCPTTYRWFKSRGQVISASNAKAGDIIFFTWDNSNNADHVGIIEVVNGNIITTIEGNKNNAVERRNINKDNRCIFAVCRPAYIISTPAQDTKLPDVMPLIKQVNSKIGLNMRADTTVRSNIIVAIPRNEEVVVLQENCANADGYTWDKVQWHNYVGFVANRYLSIVNNPSAQPQTYTVQSGDTLSGIANSYGTTWQNIYNNNRDIIGSNPNLIKPGQILKV